LKISEGAPRIFCAAERVMFMQALGIVSEELGRSAFFAADTSPDGRLGWYRDVALRAQRRLLDHERAHTRAVDRA
jgi:hypothetical protein